ncbi:MAG: hypothetical protein Q4C12_02105 [Clostridia bacterium]|nr:hypothetical protein [Clostridia bacterium]
MLVLLVIVVVLFILLAAFSSDTSNDFDTNFKEALSKKKQMINEAFEEELARKCTVPAHREKILELIKDDLVCVYGNQWNEVFADFPISNSYFMPFSSPMGIVIMLTLSKSGLMPKQYLYSKIEISNFECANAYECLRILQCVEKNIQKRKQDQSFKLKFVPYMMQEGFGKTFKLIPDYEHPCSGYFAWNYDKASMSKARTLELYDKELIRICINQSIGPRSLRTKPYKDKYLL